MTGDRPSAPSAAVRRPLRERDREVLAFEADWPAHQGNKAAAIRSTLGISAARYYQLLDRAVAHPEARRVAPLVVKRIARRRARREAGTPAPSIEQGPR